MKGSDIGEGRTLILISKLTTSDARWPQQLSDRLSANAPLQLWTIGNVEILGKRKVGLFCSVRCPGDAILGAYDSARNLRDEGVTVVSGFHSPVEKECLRILLRGKQPIIICLARAMEKIRLPADWRNAVETGRMLLISPFEKRPRRPDKNTARRRNELVAALSDEVLIIHAEPGGRIEHITMLVDRWSIPRRHPRING
ncbi:MAG: DNA-processing protein DprA [Deltaproteobacteria bacterium]|nr:DNA-processing protein DprA [Deltaproteobacteria bacterium]MBI2228769.1 DNA-processing protein DprA [Deltaproteobacteria bacterium]MBI2367201.1 DNA-processing protein DprA [Deltaproteobacteria bacterium]